MTATTPLLVRLKVNGQNHDLAIASHHTLCEVLRYQLRLTGTKQGCDKGDCGACTILVDDKPILSCITLASTLACTQQHTPHITTIEGLSSPKGLHPVQAAFDKCGALQCGFCQPGMMLSSHALLKHNPHPDDQEIKEALSGNLCRCTGYVKIIEAVQLAAKENAS